ncbi:MAG: diaminopimelate epimerase, partial [Pseudomonadota bacterium]
PPRIGKFLRQGNLIPGKPRGIELQVGPIDDPILHTPSVANIGNPHAIFWVEQPVEIYDLARFGSMLEHHPLFPEAANISIAQVVSNEALIMRTWERGVGLTLACGSAACAAAACAARKGLTGRRVSVRQPGGVLEIHWRDDNFLVMTGAVEEEFRGLFDPTSGAWTVAV